ncbi:MAG: indoleamine 2,3-dioxygenase [Sphingomonadales bacterium]|jgi:indoleamine 2,3-dioxygenase
MNNPLVLSEYQITPERGFLGSIEADEISLDSAFAPMLDAAGQLSALITSGRIRHYLRDLPLIETEAFARDGDEHQVRLAMVHYSFLVQAYVWGEEEAPKSLPVQLAKPIYDIAKRLDQAPLLPYSGYVLDNYYRLDKSAPLSLENAAMFQNFLGGADENWFVLVHVAIEARAGSALALIPQIFEAIEQADEGRVERLLGDMHDIWTDINAIFDRMIERCDPYIYYNRVRPYIHGWKNNPALGDGLIYEGVEAYGGKPQAFRGQTGSQSSIVPTMDALYGIRHEDDPLREFLLELHQYRPKTHRRFIEDVGTKSRLRPFIAVSERNSLHEAYKICVEDVARFRTKHLEYAAQYINKQSISGPGNDVDVGTGGTPFMRYLKKHRDENRAQSIT